MLNRSRLAARCANPACALSRQSKLKCRRDMGKLYRSFLLSTVLLLGAGNSCLGQEPEPAKAATTCFEVLLPQGRAFPAAPLRFNRCTGESWILVRRGVRTSKRMRHDTGLRWVKLEVDPVTTNGRQNLSKSLRPLPRNSYKAGSQRCFTFVGRQFCE
jgi:hypothetical protein